MKSKLVLPVISDEEIITQTQMGLRRPLLGRFDILEAEYASTLPSLREVQVAPGVTQERMGRHPALVARLRER